MDWFLHPLTQILGVPTFWIVRLAKMLQLASGSVILMEILGLERVEGLSRLVQTRLAETKAAQRVRDIGGAATSTFAGFAGIPSHTHLTRVVSDPNAPGESLARVSVHLERFVPTDKVGHLITLVGGGIFSAVVASRYYGAMRGEPSLLGATGVFLLMFALVGVPGVYMILVLLAIVVSLGSIALQHLLEALTKAFVGILRRRKLSQMLLIASFVLLVAGAFLELLAS